MKLLQDVFRKMVMMILPRYGMADAKQRGLMMMQFGGQERIIIHGEISGTF
jgi:hypothetical protein